MRAISFNPANDGSWNERVRAENCLESLEERENEMNIDKDLALIFGVISLLLFAAGFWAALSSKIVLAVICIAVALVSIRFACRCWREYKSFWWLPEQLRRAREAVFKSVRGDV